MFGKIAMAKITISELAEVDTREAINQFLTNNSVEELREHLGCSLSGSACPRQMWYSFRWIKQEKFDGTLLRLFARGNREEQVFVELLRNAGVEVWDKAGNGEQFKVSAFGDHLGGSLDGIAKGIKEEPETKFVLEFKTHNQNSFNALIKKGVRESKPEHYAQMQLYMHLFSLTRAYYAAVCKNDDRFWGEVIEYDKKDALALMDRMENVIFASTPPSKISEDPNFFICRFCNFKHQCHEKCMPEHVSCRNCINAIPELYKNDYTGVGGRWSCSYKKINSLSVKIQKQGCDDHVIIPELTHLEILGGSSELNQIKYNLPNGNKITNGTNAINSKEFVKLK
jgi:hypothetical protein